MTTAQEEQNDASVAEPPAKRRRGGRRTVNPDISAEERKRLRVLKNRESAMRSLARKAEYSAQLEAKVNQVKSECKSKKEALEKLVTTAVGLRSALEKIPSDDIAKAIATEAETCINRATAVLASEEFLPLNSNDQNTAAKSPLAVTGGEDNSK